MPLMLPKVLPRRERLQKATAIFPTLEPGSYETFLNLLRASQELRRAVETPLLHAGVSHGRFAVLMRLLGAAARDTPGLTPATLAGMASVSRATISGLLDSLERDALVEREISPGDRRERLVRLTKKGAALVRSLARDHFHRVSSLLSCVSLPDQRRLVTLLQRITRHADTLNPSPKQAAAK